MTNGRNFPMKHPGGKPSHYQRLTETACSPLAARGFDKILAINQLCARGQYPGFWTRDLLVASSVGGSGKIQR